jgi:hypothetical protein
MVDEDFLSSDAFLAASAFSYSLSSSSLTVRSLSSRSALRASAF